MTLVPWAARHMLERDDAHQVPRTCSTRVGPARWNPTLRVDLRHARSRPSAIRLLPRVSPARHIEAWAEASTSRGASPRRRVRRRSSGDGAPRQREVPHCRGAGGSDGRHSAADCETPVRRECGKWIDTVWVPTWDAIRLESSLRQAEIRRVPDIVLEKDGVAIGAIEVLVSHAVDGEKAAALAALGVPWLEVRADERLIESPGWSIDLALAVHRAGGLEEWRCDRDQLVYDTAAEGQRHGRVREAEARRHTTAVAAARVVDVY